MISKDLLICKGFLTHKARVVRVHVFPMPDLPAEKASSPFPPPKARPAWFESTFCPCCFSGGKSLEPFPGAHGLVSRRPRPGSIPRGVARLAQGGPILKNGLIGPLTAPNDVLIRFPSGKFRGAHLFL
mgnify:CR=1 FL=1